MPYQVGGAKPVSPRFVIRPGDVQFNERVFVIDSHLQTCVAFAKTANLENRMQRVGAETVEDLSLEIARVGVTTLPEDGDQGSATIESANSKALEAALPKFGQRIVVLHDKSILAEKGSQPFRQPDDTPVREHIHTL
jgi:hypothetical protein